MRALFVLLVICVMFLTATPVAAGDGSTITTDAVRQTTEGFNRHIVEVINDIRGHHGLAPLEIREAPGSVTTYMDCVSGLNQQAWNNNSDLIGHDYSYQCLHPDEGLIETFFSTTGSIAPTVPALNWYRSPPHRGALLSNADILYLRTESFLTSHGQLHMVLGEFVRRDASVPTPGFFEPSYLYPEFGYVSYPSLSCDPAFIDICTLSYPQEDMRSPISGAEPPVDPSIPQAYYRYQIARLYIAYFGRRPDDGGWLYWNQQHVNGGIGLHEISSYFALSGEFTNLYGAVDNDRFVTLVYRNVMERDPDRVGHEYWLSLLNENRISRGEVMVYFSESTEFIRRAGPELLHEDWNGDVLDSYRIGLADTVGIVVPISPAD